MNPRQSYVSVVEPVSPAVERVKTVLFRPFDLGRWFIIGFCAWLASLGNPDGGNRGGVRVNSRGGGFHDFPTDIREGIEEVRYYIMGNLGWIIPVGVIVLVLAVGVGFLLVWLGSRGRFMFLYCVAQNKAEVKNPWRQFRRHANSLFAFRIVVGILCFLAVAAFIIPALVTIYVLKVTLGSTALSILGIVAYIASFVTVMMLFGIIGKFTKDFVVPIMYLHTASCRQAWAMLLDLLAVNKMRLILYLLFQIVIVVAIMTIVIGLGCATCGCACCFFALPYVGTVAFLPILVFLRAYSLYYLAQYGPQFNVFPSLPQATAPMTEPLT